MTAVTVELLDLHHPRVNWREIRSGEIFMGDIKVAPADFPPGVYSGGYGLSGPWLKPFANCLYDFRSSCFWNCIGETTWVENYRPLKRVRFVELSEGINL